MAGRQITKQLAQKIVSKLKAKPSPGQRKGSPHDLYDVEYEGHFIGQISLRRGSNREAGHDHIPDELQIKTFQAKMLGQCPLTREQFYEIMREKGLLPESSQGGESND